MNKDGNYRLDSWKEIAAYLGRNERTAIRWERKGLPVHRVPGGQRQPVFAYAQEIDAWLVSQDGKAAGPGTLDEPTSKPDLQGDDDGGASALPESQRAKRTLRPVPPPRAAQFALLLIPKKNREHLVGDLEEEYRTKLFPKHGRFWAQLWYWEQTLVALGFYVWPFLKRVLGMAAIWKVMGR